MDSGASATAAGMGFDAPGSAVTAPGVRRPSTGRWLPGQDLGPGEESGRVGVTRSGTLGIPVSLLTVSSDVQGLRGGQGLGGGLGDGSPSSSPPSLPAGGPAGALHGQLLDKPWVRPRPLPPWLLGEPGRGPAPSLPGSSVGPVWSLESA